MREIKFRGMGLNNGEWVYGVGVTKYLFSIENHAWIYDVNGGWIEVYPETVGEYIGRLDKNDKEIYEGDIVHGQGCGYAVVVFKQGMFTLACQCGKFDRAWNPDATKVIGYIHENPELLGGVK